MGEESVTSIHLYDEFYVNLLFDRSIYPPMCTHMGNSMYLGAIIPLINLFKYGPTKFRKFEKIAGTLMVKSWGCR